MECLNFPPFSSYRCRLPGLLKIHFIIIIILWTSDPAEQCKPISIHIILIQNPIAGAGWLTHLTLPDSICFTEQLPFEPPTQNLELVREIIWLCTFDSIFLFLFCRVIPKWSQWTRRLEWLLLYLMLYSNRDWGRAKSLTFSQSEIQSVQTVQASRLSGSEDKKLYWIERDECVL